MSLQNRFRRKTVSVKVPEDSLHIAIATLHHVDFLLTWNCPHIANPFIQEDTVQYPGISGLFFSIICTPEELLGEQIDEIFTELQAAKDAIGAKFNYDLRALFDQLMRGEAELQAKGINLTRFQ